MKEQWNHKESIKNNLESMGIAFDANKVIKQKSKKQDLIEKVTGTVEDQSSGSAPASQVVEKLEAQVAEAEANKKSNFRFTKEQVKWITYCLDKHGDDFKAMAKDPKNIWQETPKQIKQKVLKFIQIPEQFAVYAKLRGLLDDSE